MKSFSAWLNCGLVACSLALLRRTHAAVDGLPPSGRASELATNLSLIVDGYSDGQVVRANFRFPERSKRWRSQAGSFLAGAKTCTLPTGLNFRAAKQSPSLLQLLAAHTPFTFLRVGDGDWYCALGGTGLDSNGVALEHEHGMCEQLKNDIKQYGSTAAANFFPVLGTFFLCKERSFDLFAHVDDFFSENPLPHGFSRFLDSNSVGFYFPLLPAKKQGRASGVVPALAGQVVVMVGPKHLRKLNVMLNYTAFVEVPLHTCWEAKDAIMSGITRESHRHSSAAVVFLFAGGIAARTILFKMFLQLGQKDTFIDVGSSLDGFAGIASRDYNKNISRVCSEFPEYAADGVCPGRKPGSGTGARHRGGALHGAERRAVKRSSGSHHADAERHVVEEDDSPGAAPSASARRSHFRMLNGGRHFRMLNGGRRERAAVAPTRPSTPRIRTMGAGNDAEESSDRASDTSSGAVPASAATSPAESASRNLLSYAEAALQKINALAFRIVTFGASMS